MTERLDLELIKDRLSLSSRVWKAEREDIHALIAEIEQLRVENEKLANALADKIYATLAGTIEDPPREKREGGLNG